MSPENELTYFTTDELAAAASLLSGESAEFLEPGPPPTDEALELRGITGGYAVEGRSYGVEALALLSMVSSALAGKVERYLSERGWHTPEVLEMLDQTRKRLSAEIDQSGH